MVGSGPGFRMLHAAAPIFADDSHGGPLQRSSCYRGASVAVAGMSSSQFHIVMFWVCD